MEQEGFQLFLDLDGVLVDFNRGVRFYSGKGPEEQTAKQMWSVLSHVKNFYAKLSWTEDGPELWEKTRSLDPVILTGLPLGKWAEPQKREWCRRELGQDVPVICGMSRDKHLLAWDWLYENNLGHLTPILIDDRLNLKFPWEEGGGRFILHFSARESLKRLEEVIGKALAV
ncbi:MAG: hypothetical protein PQJ60_11990 [Spirochaetales bacterium]|nr:hypothetical protein [Spirochaetales bacterium]